MTAHALHTREQIVMNAMPSQDTKCFVPSQFAPKNLPDENWRCSSIEYLRHLVTLFCVYQESFCTEAFPPVTQNHSIRSQLNLASYSINLANLPRYSNHER